MALTKFNESVTNHQSLPDKPSLTSAQLKTLFDKASVDIKTYINSTLTSEIDNILTQKLNKSDIVNNLTSTATDKPLSAKQGKDLKDLIYSVVETKSISGNMDFNGYTELEINLPDQVDRTWSVFEYSFGGIVFNKNIDFSYSAENKIKIRYNGTATGTAYYTITFINI